MPDRTAPDAPHTPTRRPVDAGALTRHRARLEQAAGPPWLHTEVARRMAERLPLIRLQPRRVLDWHGFLGASQALLAEAYPEAQRRVVEGSPGRREATQRAVRAPWWSLRRLAGSVATPEVLLPSEVPSEGADLLWANMALQAEPDPADCFRRWHQALAVDGFLMFSTFGPGTLTGLAALYAEAGWPPPFAPFVDMHDLGDMLVAAGFAEPVMDQETITLTWADPGAALAELRSLGGNAAPGRLPGLRTPRWRARLLEALARRAGPDGRVALAFEVVYGHALRVAPRPRVAAETTVGLDTMRAMVRSAPRRT